MWQIPNFVIYAIFFIDLFISFFYLLNFIKSKLIKENKTLKKYFSIAFVIPVYNESRILKDSVKSIKNSDYPQDKVRIIIVDDGSTDDTLEIAEELACKYSGISVYTKKNTGKADTLNYGLAKARTELIAVLDADTIMQPDLIKKAIVMFSDETTAAVTSRFKPLNRKNFLERMQCVEYAMSGFVRMLIGKLNSLPVAPAFTIFRREFLLKYGYFDVDNLTEDFEMGLRVQHAGYNIAYISDSCALTGVPGTFKKLQRQRLRWGYGTMYNYKKYKQMILNPKYGDLGMFILPTWIFGFFLTSAVFLFLIYNAISKCIETFQKLVAGWIPSFVFDIEKAAFTFTELRFLLFVLSFIMALLAFLLTKAEIDDEIRFIDFVPFLLIYPWILALAYLNAIYHLVRGKKPAW